MGSYIELFMPNAVSYKKNYLMNILNKTNKYNQVNYKRYSVEDIWYS